jgi:NADH-quinone oxidoreductase E subunit
MAYSFSPETKEKFDTLLTRYPEKKAALIPTLWLAQEELGWLPPDALAYCAEMLELPPSKALSVASFYTMFNLKPVGRYKIEVCRTLSCALCGAFEILDHLEKRLGVQVGETTSDGKFTLMTQECLASCGTGPMMQVNGKRYYENLTPERVDEILASLS